MVITRAKVLMATAISTATLLSLAAMLPAATTTISSAFGQIPRHILVELTALPIVLPDPQQPSTLIEIDPPSSREPTIIVNPGSGAAEVILPPRD